MLPRGPLPSRMASPSLPFPRGLPLPRRLCPALAAAATALLLEGCGPVEPWCTTGRRQGRMPAGQAQIELDVRSLWKRLDELAGCRNEWDFGTGNPCASDVPVPWAKKGLEIGADEAWLNAFGIENTVGTCIDRSSSSRCTKWIESKGGCWREEASVCSCGSQSGEPCQEWSCVAKDVHHQSCWEAEWEEVFDTECGPAGFSPWPLGREIGINYTEFQSILSAESSQRALAVSISEAVALLKPLQERNSYRYGRHCIAQRTVGGDSSKKPPCDTWRQISSKAFSCRCLHPISPGGYCERWHCDSSTQLSAAEIHDYVCLESSNGTCSRWSAEVAGPLAQVGECRTCIGTGNVDCLFVCRYVSTHRIIEFPVGVESGWGDRFGHAILHLLWLLPISATFAIVLVIGDGAESYVDWGIRSCCALIVMGFAVVFAWLFAFYRDVKDSGALPPIPRWEVRSPTLPLLGLFVTFGVALLCGMMASLPLERNKSKHFGPVIVVPLVVASLCLLWSCGMAIAWLPLGCLICFLLLSVRVDLSD